MFCVKQECITGADPGFQVMGGALEIFFGVFHVKNHDFTQKKIIFFPIAERGGGGVRAGCARPCIKTFIWDICEWKMAILPKNRDIVDAFNCSTRSF